MNIDQMIAQMTCSEKIALLTGGGEMCSAENQRFGITSKRMADGPHGIRTDFDKRDGNCTFFPNLCALAATFNPDAARRYGNALADDCIEHDIDMILGPGVNIKKNILCGRNFEYFSEDPVLAGELAAAYINGVQENGVAACLKHYACNNQEKFRIDTSVEIDERTLREIYLKAFEIVIQKSNPVAIMCAYNKINSIWCSENKMLLDEILREDFGYRGFVVSDWGAVQDIAKALNAGLDLEMPKNDRIFEQITAALEAGDLSMEVIDKAVRRVLSFATRNKPAKKPYDRARQHKIAQELAAESIVLLKNEQNALPLAQYKKIAVIGEFADKPLLGGQGSAEVYPDAEMVDNPLEALRKALPNTEILYRETYLKRSFPDIMLWPQLDEFHRFIQDAEAVVFFAGSMESEDSEHFDRRTAELNQNYEMFMEESIAAGKKTIVVLQSGSAIIPGDWEHGAAAIVEMWLSGEGAGQAIADVLTGKINPSGKLPETFPNKMRRDFEYPGDGLKVLYDDRLNVGYRYYDRHPDEICYPFGHGLSYTDFALENAKVAVESEEIRVSFDIKNIGECDGAQVVQLYVSDPVSTMIRPLKELKAFQKIFIRCGESVPVEISVPVQALSYYNVMLHRWVIENGVYDILLGFSSRDIRAKLSIDYQGDLPYTLKRVGNDMIG